MISYWVKNIVLLSPRKKEMHGINHKLLYLNTLANGKSTENIP